MSFLSVDSFALKVAKTMTVFSGLAGLLAMPTPAKEFADPGSFLVSAQGSFNYSASRIPLAGGEGTYLNTYWEIASDERVGIFVARGFFIGPAARSVFYSYDGGTTSNFQNFGGVIGGAFPISGTPLVPYFGAMPTWSHQTYSYSGDFESSQSSSNGFNYTVFAGLMLQFGHLGIPVEMGYTRSNLDDRKYYDFDIKVGFAGLFY